MFNSSLVIGLCGNKSDLYENEEIPEEEARQFASKIGAVFKLTSASENIGIDELFYELGGKFLDPNFKMREDMLQDCGKKEEKIEWDEMLGKTEENKGKEFKLDSAAEKRGGGCCEGSSKKAKKTKEEPEKKTEEKKMNDAKKDNNL